MIRIALLATALAGLAAGCSNQKPEERKLPGSAAPATTSTTPPPTTGAAAPGSAAPGSAAPQPKGTGFSPFDDALAGTKPWVAADDKAGVVEMHAVEDLSARTPGKFSVDRRCGADAAKAVEAIGKRIAERLKDHEPPQCKEKDAVMGCYQLGLTEGDVIIEVEYGKSGDAWRVIGVKTYGHGSTPKKEQEKYTALLKEKCK